VSPEPTTTASGSPAQSAAGTTTTGAGEITGAPKPPPVVALNSGARAWRKGWSSPKSPIAAWFLDHPDGWGFAVFPETGGHGWESAYRGKDDGYSYEDWFKTLAEAKASCERRYDREAALLVAVEPDHIG
jgi:hypothetical protein